MPVITSVAGSEQSQNDKGVKGNLCDMPYYQLRGDSSVIPEILWFMEPGNSVPHSQGLSNSPYPDPNQPNYTY